MEKEYLDKLRGDPAIKSALGSKEGAALKAALQRNAGDVEKLRGALLTGNTDKAKEVLSLLLSDEKNAAAIAELEKKLKGSAGR